MDNSKNVKQALITDDTPNAKLVTILSACGVALVTVALGVLLYFSGQYHWNIFITIGALLVWIVLDILWWQLWRSIAFHLTVNETEIILQKFCHKKVMRLNDVKSYRRNAVPNGKFVGFTLKSDNATIFFQTQYPEEMIVILQTRTTATEDNSDNSISEEQTNS